MTGSGRGEGRARTFTEQARRRQLVELTVALVAEHGYAGCFLRRIADAAGVTKTAALRAGDRSQLGPGRGSSSGTGCGREAAVRAGGARLGFHLHNTDDDADRVIEALT